jgi:heme o synthase
MKRTYNRPLPSGRVSPTEAAVVGTAMGAAGVGILSVMTNPVVTALGAGNILLYSGLYTFSKRKTEFNTWIGSVVGAVPPLMGYAAASGGTFLTGDAAILSGLLFLWQFPHFFALSWMYRDDYARGGFQMVAVNDPSGVRTAKLITEYSLYLTALPLVATAAGLTSSMYAVEGTVANAYLVHP